MRTTHNAPPARGLAVPSQRSARAEDLLRLTLSWPPDGDPLITVGGEVDILTCDAVDTAIERVVRLTPPRLTLDLSGASFFGARGMSCLCTAATSARQAGVALEVLTSPRIARVLESTARQGELAGVTLRTAGGQQPAPGTPPSTAHQPRRPGGARDGELTALRRQVSDLRAALRTRPRIGQALDLLLERYRLTDSTEAFDLLQRASQQHDVRLPDLADALLVAPPPRRSGGWFSAREREPVPPLTLQPRVRRGGDCRIRSLVLTAVLDAALAAMDETTGDLQVASPSRDGLQLELAHGLSRQFTDYFAQVHGTGTACAAALRTGAPVSVPDVATDPIISDERARGVLLEQGFRATYSTPLTSASPDRKPHTLGVLSTYHTRRGRVPSPGERRELDAIAGQAGAWLDWHRRTIVLDALEYLHAQATQSG